MAGFANMPFKISGSFCPSFTLLLKHISSFVLQYIFNRRRNKWSARCEVSLCNKKKKKKMLVLLHSCCTMEYLGQKFAAFLTNRWPGNALRNAPVHWLTLTFLVLLLSRSRSYLVYLSFLFPLSSVPAYKWLRWFTDYTCFILTLFAAEACACVQPSLRKRPVLT